MAHLQALEPERQRRLESYQAAHRDREILSEALQMQREPCDREQICKEQKRLDDSFIRATNAGRNPGLAARSACPPYSGKN